MTEELEIKIGTEEEVAWTEIKKKAGKDIKESKRAIIIGEEIVKIADKMIKQEKS